MEISKVQLIGSRARGDFRPNSDWDFLVYSNFVADAPYFSSIQFPSKLPAETVAEIQSRVPEGAQVDIFLQYTWGAHSGHAVLYDSHGILVWDHSHGCAGGWLCWEGDFPAHEPKKRG